MKSIILSLINRCPAGALRGFLAFFLLLMTSKLVIGHAYATDITSPTSFLSCGVDYDRWKDQYASGGLSSCSIQSPIVDGAGKPIPASAHPRLWFHIAAGAQDSTQPEGNYPVSMGSTSSYSYCTFTQEYYDRFPQASYPTVFSFHVSADGYANSPDYLTDSKNPCNDKNTKQRFGTITLQKTSVTYGCYQDGACKQVTDGSSPEETFGSDTSCNNQCGVWQVYNREGAGTTGPKYVCRDPSNPDAKPPEGATPVDTTKYYILQKCEAAASGENIDFATHVPYDPPKPPPPAPLPPCSAAYRNTNGDFLGCDAVSTSLGMSISTNPASFIADIFSILLSLSGGVAILLIIRSGYKLMTSQGDPEKVKEAREVLTSAIVGLLFLIFSLIVLEIIGVDILHIPGLRH